MRKRAGQGSRVRGSARVRPGSACRLRRLVGASDCRRDLNKPPLGHMEADAPALLNVLRVCDIPDVLGMLAPRSLVIYSDRAATLAKVAAIYATAGEPRKFTSGPTK